MNWTISTTTFKRPRREKQGVAAGSARGGFTIIELLVVVTILAVIMAMVGYIMVKALELKSLSENRLDDLVGGLAAGRLLERDLRSMSEYSDPTVVPPPPGWPRVVYYLDSVTIDGKAKQPVLYLKTSPDRFATRNGDTEYVRWFVKNGILCRETLNLTTNLWLDLDTATDLDLEPIEVLRGVAWTVALDPLEPSRIEVAAKIYPSLNSHHRVELNGEPPESLTNNEKPRTVLLQFQTSRTALTCRTAQELALP